MVTTLKSSWWALALRGLAAIIFGILAFVWPGITVTVLVFLFGAYAIVDGIFALVAAARQGSHSNHFWTWILEGIIGIVAGIVAFFMPGLTAVVLLYLIAAWAVVTGVLEIVAAIRLRREIKGELFLALSGLVSILLGIALFLFPAAGLLATVWMIGVYAILFGILMIILAFRLRAYGTTGLYGTT